jgi:hypothetical protein
MSTIKAIVRNGRLETDEPIDLPEGTALQISLPDSIDDDGWDNSPEGIAARLAAMETIQPLIFTDDERAAWEAAQKEQKEWEFAHWNENTEKIKGLWK